MTANVVLIGDALRLLNVISESETPSAEQGSHALRRLNQLMEVWEEEDVKLGYFAQSDTTATCPIPAYAEKGVTGVLALDLAATYGAEPSAACVKFAEDGYQLILRKAVNAKLQGVDMTHLGSGARFNIETGE